jgi:biotin synthase
MNLQTRAFTSGGSASFWADALAEAVVAGASIDAEAGLRILRTSDGDLPQLLWATFRIREQYHARRVKLCVLRNARSGMCGEDCSYCSQSKVSEAPIPTYRLDALEELLAAARNAVAVGARRFCMVTSGRGPTRNDLARFTAAARLIKQEFPHLELCVSLGMMDVEQARTLKESGIGWVNHNLNTSERFHPEICTTHSYADRVRTVENVRRAGLSTCSGGIVGMGETDEDLVDLAFALRRLRVDAVPVNFFHPIEGTPLAGLRELTPGRCLKALCLFRFANAAAEVRVAGGWEYNFGWFQPLAFFAANSIFVEGYLTTPGQASSEAQRMIEDMGFVVEGVEFRD